MPLTFTNTSLCLEETLLIQEKLLQEQADKLDIDLSAARVLLRGFKYDIQVCSTLRSVQLMKAYVAGVGCRHGH